MEAKFRRKLSRLCPEGKVVVAVSGGGDSVALAVLVRAAGRDAVLAHLDHALREDSPRDAEFVEDLGARLGFPVVVERVDVGRIARMRGENLEAVAREIRYAFLSRVAKAHGATCVLTAHTADDQAETVLFQLLTGTARGFGIRARQGRIARPLIGVRRQALRAYLREKGIFWREDPTNRDTSRDRAYLRHEILPRLEARFPQAVSALGRYARIRQEEEPFFEDEARRLLLTDSRFGVPAVRATPLLLAPKALRHRALRLFLESAGLRPEARWVAALEAALGGQKRMIARGTIARRYLGTLFLIPPPPAVPRGSGQDRPAGLSPCTYAKRLRLADGRKLEEVFRAHGVPPELRKSWDLACRGSEVAWVRGLVPEPEAHRWMRRAIELARASAEAGEVPVGAVVVREGQVLGEAGNEVERTGDATAHAELIALKRAMARVGEKVLPGAELYVSLEPCPMCYGALREAGIRRLHYAVENLKAGAFSVYRLPRVFEVRAGRLEREGAKLLSGFFARLRSEGCRSG